MTEPKNLPQWTPRPCTLEDTMKGGNDPDLQKTATTVPDHQHHVLNHHCTHPERPHRVAQSYVGESVLDMPIFRGGSWDGPEAEDHDVFVRPCSAVSVDIFHEEERDERMLWTAADRSKIWGRGADAKEPVRSCDADKGNGEKILKVRFAPDETAGVDSTSTASGEAPLPCLEHTTVDTGAEEEFYFADGQCFVRQRNGMHTAWRLREVGRNDKGRPSTPLAPAHIRVAATAAAPSNGTASATTTIAHQTSGARTDDSPPKSSRWTRSMSASRLISLTTSSAPQRQQQPVRLFLRRSRTSLSIASPNTECTRAPAVVEAVRRDQGIDGSGEGSRARRIAHKSGPSQAFLLPWTGRDNVCTRPSPRAGRAGPIEVGGRLLEAMITPPPRQVGSATVAAVVSNQQQRYGGGSGAGLGHRPRRQAVRSTSPGTNNGNGRSSSSGGDENSPPPPRATAAPLSSPAVRRNLARAARRSKVGTNADPVTLYRQRQELEQVQKKVAATNRGKSSREGRISSGSLSGSGKTAGLGRARTAETVVGMAWIC